MFNSTIHCLLSLSLLAGQAAHANSGKCLDVKAFEGTYRVDTDNCNVPYGIVFGENPVIEGRPSLLPEEEFVITAGCDRLIFTTANIYSNGEIVLVDEDFAINEDGVTGTAKVEYKVQPNLIVADEETKRKLPLAGFLYMRDEVTAKWSLEAISNGSKDLLYKSDMSLSSYYPLYSDVVKLKHSCVFKRK